MRSHRYLEAELPSEHSGLEQRLAELRPKLHRYCARMTGSVIDGEDVVQDALIKAIEARPEPGAIANLDAWLFRIAHNAALDFLRRQARQNRMITDEDLDMIADPSGPRTDPLITEASLRTFMRLPAAQRSCVILMDVLGYSLQEIAEMMATTVAGVKAALHRGRAQLRRIATEPDDTAPPAMDATERRRLADYVARFNARDFDAIRAMLADDVRLELVARTRMQGRDEVANYFTNYNKVDDWDMVPGLIDGRAALIVRDPRDTARPPVYFVLLDWDGERLAGIRDFRYARYALDHAEVIITG